MIHLQICIKDEEESKMKIRNGEIFFFLIEKTAHIHEKQMQRQQKM